jgi:hypothetical protein
MGDHERNVIKSFKAYTKLIDAGFMAFAPLTSHYIDKYFKRSYNSWMQIDFYWITKCDCLLRLPGKSKGADMEVDEAKRLGIPVFYSIDELKKYYREHHKRKCDNCDHNKDGICEVFKYTINNVYKNECKQHKIKRGK